MPYLVIPQRLKYIVLFIYVSIAIVALVFSIIGVTWLTNGERFFLVKHRLITDGTLAVAIGLTMIVSVSLGIYAVLNENTCLLAVVTTPTHILDNLTTDSFQYGGILMSTFLVLAAYGAHNLMVILTIEETIFARLEVKIRNFFNEDFYAENLHESLIRIQREFKCCGPLGPHEYPIVRIPSSCCEEEIDPCDKPYALGCARAMTNELTDIYKWNAIFSITIAVLSFVGATLILSVSQSKLKALSSGISI